MRKREAAAMEAARVAKRLADRQEADAINGNRNDWAGDITVYPELVEEEDEQESTVKLEATAPVGDDTVGFDTAPVGSDTIKQDGSAPAAEVAENTMLRRLQEFKDCEAAEPVVEEAENTMLRRLQEFKDRAAPQDEPAGTKKGITMVNDVDVHAQSMIQRLQQFKDLKVNSSHDEQPKIDFGLVNPEVSMVARLAAFKNAPADERDSEADGDGQNVAEATMMNRLKMFKQAREAMVQELPEPLSPRGIAREAAERKAAQWRMEEAVQRNGVPAVSSPPKDLQLLLDIEGIKAANQQAIKNKVDSPRKNSPRESPRVACNQYHSPRVNKNKKPVMDRYDQRAAERAQKELMENQQMADQVRRKAEFKKKQADKKIQKAKEEEEHKKRLLGLRAANRRESSVREMIQAHKKAAKAPKVEENKPRVVAQAPPAELNPELEARKQKREEQRQAMQERMELAKKNLGGKESAFGFELVLDKRDKPDGAGSKVIAASES